MTTTSLPGQFDLRHDLDYFRVTLAAGQRYLFKMTGGGGSPVDFSTIDLFGPGNTSFDYASDAWDSMATSDGGAVFSFVAAASGTHYLRATTHWYSSLSGAATGSYNVSVEAVALDDHSDLRDLGTALAVGSTLPGQFDLRHDVDSFRINLVGGQRYLFTMNGGGATPVQGSEIGLLDPAGQPMVDDAAGTSAGGARFAYVAPASGTYFLLSTLGQGANSTTQRDVGSYTVGVSSVALDDHSDLRDQGTVLNLGATVPGLFDLRHDQDYFRVDLTQGQRYLFSMTGAGAAPVQGSEMALLAPAGEQLVMDWADTVDGGAAFSFVARESGTHFLLSTLGQGVAGGDPDTGSYAVNLVSVALDDHSDLRGSGTPLALNATVPGAFDLRHDLDYFRVNLVEGQRYLFTMTGAGDEPVTFDYLTLFDTDNIQVKLDISFGIPGIPDLGGGNGAKFAYTAPGTGTYFLLAQLGSAYVASESATGTYTVSASPVALDDHSDLRTSGTVLNVGATLAGTFDLRHDEDWFRVTLGAGQRYYFEMKGAAGAPSNDTLSLILWSDAGLPVVLDADTAQGGGARFSYQAPTSGTYYLQASRPPGSVLGGDTGSYTVKLTQVALDDHSDLREQGTTLVIEGSAGNAPPQAANGSANMAEDSTLSGILPAATDANGDPIAYSKAADPGSGTVSVSANGSYTYIPIANFHGTDAFSFSVSDGKGGSNSYAMSLTVTPVNDAPTGDVTVTGTAQIFQTLSAVSTLADVEGLGPLSYQWLQNGAVIGGAASSSYTLSTADAGAAISVQVSYTDGAGTAEVVLSAATGAVSGYNVINGTAGADTLGGTAGPDSISGLAGNDSIEGKAGNDEVDGGAGVDIAVFGATRADATFGTAADGHAVTSVLDGTDSLASVERLKFADISVALDLSGNAGTVAKILGAVFGPPEVSNEVYVGIGLYYIDGGMSYESLVQLAIDARLGPGASHRAIVDLLYTNVAGAPPSPQEEATFVALLDTNVFTVAGLGVYAADFFLNLDNIDLVGLADRGLEYLPYAGG